MGTQQRSYHPHVLFECCKNMQKLTFQARRDPWTCHWFHNKNKLPITMVLNKSRTAKPFLGISQRLKTQPLSVKKSSSCYRHTCPNHLPTSFSIAFGSEIDCANGSRFLFVSSTVANIFTFSGSSSASKLTLMIVPSLATVAWLAWCPAEIGTWHDRHGVDRTRKTPWAMGLWGYWGPGLGLWRMRWSKATCDPCSHAKKIYMAYVD